MVAFGCLWATFGHLWAHFGRTLGVIGAPWAPIGTPWAPRHQKMAPTFEKNARSFDFLAPKMDTKTLLSYWFLIYRPHIGHVAFPDTTLCAGATQLSGGSGGVRTPPAGEGGTALEYPPLSFCLPERDHIKTVVSGTKWLQNGCQSRSWESLGTSWEGLWDVLGTVLGAFGSILEKKWRC